MAGIIKATGRTTQRKEVQPVAFNLDDMNGKATAFLDDARHRAEKIVEQANTAATQVIKAAEEQGQQAALQAATVTAEAKVDQQLDTLVPALTQAIQLIQQEREQWLRHWEQHAIQLSVAIAERLIGRELKSAPEISIDVIRKALELAAGQEQVKVHLSPHDYETLGDRVQMLAGQISNLASMEIISDPHVSVGGCLVKSEYGEIDHQFATQLERIKQELI